MIRRLRWFTAAFFVLYCSSVLAIGLGELTLNSALNQRFDAEISLSGGDTLEQQEIVPKLASQVDFDRLSVDRNYQLIDLQFEVKARPNGDYYVHVISKKPVIEPFLNFIVEVIWPTGRILREYTVLLDPPVFGFGKAGMIEPSRTSRGSSGQLDSIKSGINTRGQRRSTLSSVSVSNIAIDGPLTQDDEYVIGPGDTLWEIALEVRPNDSIPAPPIMLAIQRENPEAFIKNNINLLKAGYVLRIPDLLDLSAETLTEAVAEVNAQNEEFTGLNSNEVTQLDARQRVRNDDDVFGEAEDSDGELRLIASAEQNGRRSGSDGAMSEELESSLSVVREDLDRARRANIELSVRLDDLASQVETLDDIVKLKDDQLAALQAELQRAQASETESSLPAVKSSVVQPQKTISFLSNPLFLAGLAVILIGGIVAAMILMRKRRESADLEGDIYQTASLAEPVYEPEVAEAEVKGAETEEGEDVTQQTCDVIGQADIYISYGRFSQAIGFLQKGLEIEPDRTDIQLKLLEVYVQTEDANAFSLQLEDLKKLGDIEANEQAMELQKQITSTPESDTASIGAKIASIEPVTAVADKGDGLLFDFDDLVVKGEEDDWDLDSDDLNLYKATELDDADLDLDVGDEVELSADKDIGLELDEVESIDSLELDDDDLDDLVDLDQDAGSKLGLARAYIEMGDKDGARGVLGEVIREGSEKESAEANEMLDKLD